MNCIVPGANLKVLAKALQALSKIGDELYIEAKKDRLSLITLNSSKTICARFRFFDTFFSSYEVNDHDLNADNKETLTCKVHLKVFLPLFKGNVEKKLDFFKIEYESDSDHMLFKMKYKCDDIIMLHKLRLMENESLSIGIESDSGSNNISGTSTFYNQMLSMFNVSDDEITLEITKAKVIARNYSIGAPCRPKMMRSQVNLNSTEFYSYSITKDTTINFPLKPFRTAIHFADGFNLNVEFNFEIGGKPLSMVMKNPTFEVNFIVATLNPYSDSNSSVTTTSVANKIQPQNKEKPHNVSSEDIQAMETENWENEEMADNNGRRTDSNSKRDSFTELMKKGENKGVIGVNRKNGEDEFDVIDRSPESPRTKKAKTVFGRCYDPTFNGTLLGQVLAENSDSD